MPVVHNLNIAIAKTIVIRVLLFNALERVYLNFKKRMIHLTNTLSGQTLNNLSK